MVQRKSEQEFNRQIIDAFKSQGDPEILIGVATLLAGFNGLPNIVFYCPTAAPFGKFCGLEFRTIDFQGTEFAVRTRSYTVQRRPFSRHRTNIGRYVGDQRPAFCFPVSDHCDAQQAAAIGQQVGHAGQKCR